MRKAIDLTKDVRNEMRQRIIAALGMPNMEKRWQLPNTIIKKPGTGIWIRESINEGSEEVLTNAAARQYAVVNYEIFCPAGKGADPADDAIRIIRNELPLTGEKSVVYRKGRRQAVITSIDKPAGGVALDDPEWYRRMISFTLYLYNV
ncbi:MAG: hypothetical protein IJT68_09720 [Lentisphaeria bacterium]|nr:hypothetical protein [Lentisphaeria bacterium]